VVEGAILSPLDQWHALEACPRLVLDSSQEKYATAVVVGQKDKETYLLTAWHAVEGKYQFDFHFYTRSSYPLPDWKVEKVPTVLVASSKNADFALLKVVFPLRDSLLPDLPPVPLPRLKLAGPNERSNKFPFDAVSVGSSFGEPITCQAESIWAKRFVRRPSKLEGAEQLAFFWESAGAPARGRSGGPLLNREGKLIGLCVAAKGERGYYTHQDEILAELKEAKQAWLWEE
jgi:S1-C subfamily serine protease